MPGQHVGPFRRVTFLADYHTMCPSRSGGERGPDILHGNVDDKLKRPVRRQRRAVALCTQPSTWAAARALHAARARGMPCSLSVLQTVHVCPYISDKHLNILSLPAAMPAQFPPLGWPSDTSPVMAGALRRFCGAMQAPTTDIQLGDSRITGDTGQRLLQAPQRGGAPAGALVSPQGLMLLCMNGECGPSVT